MTAKIDITNKSEEQLKELEYRIAQIGRGIDQSIKQCRYVTDYNKDKVLKDIIFKIEDVLWQASYDVDALLMQCWEALDL